MDYEADMAAWQARKDASKLRRKEQAIREIEFRERQRLLEEERERKASVLMREIGSFAYKAGCRDGSFAHAIEKYSAFQTLSIATAFYERDLPREIRDIVYGYLVRAPPNGSCVHELRFEHIRRQQEPFFAMNPAFVGKEMAHEVSEAFYSELYFEVADCDEDVVAALTQSPNVQVRPCDFLRTLNIEVRFWDSDPYQDRDSFWDGFATRYKEIANAANAVSGLVKRLDRLTVNVSVGTNIPLSQLEALDVEKKMVIIMEVLRYPVYELIHACKKVHVQYTNNDSEGGQEDTGFRDLDAWFGLSREEWEKVRRIRLSGNLALSKTCAYQICDLRRNSDPICHTIRWRASRSRMRTKRLSDAS